MLEVAGGNFTDIGYDFVYMYIYLLCQAEKATDQTNGYAQTSTSCVTFPNMVIRCSAMSTKHTCAGRHDDPP